MASVVIREARPDEYERVGALLSAAYAEYGPGEGSSVELQRAFEEYRESIADVGSRMPGSTLIVAEMDGELVGSVTYYPPRDAPMEEGWPPGWAAFRLLAVHPERRGARIGRLLTEECLSRARADGVPTLGLHTTELMKVARAMYERMGFVRVPEHDFKPAPDFTVMAYRLDL